MSLLLGHLRTIPRNSLPLVAVAAGLGVAAAVGISLGAVAGIAIYLKVAYIFVPALLTALAAHEVASDRETRFYHALLTSGVSEGGYLASRLASSATVLVAYWLATLPITLALAWNLTAAQQDAAFRYAAAGLLLVAAMAAIGVLIGVLSGRRAAAGASLSGAFLGLGLAMTLPVAELIWEGGLFDSGTRVTILSILQFAPPVAAAVATGAVELPFAAPSAAGVVVVEAALAVFAAFTFLRRQSADGWDPSPWRPTLPWALGALLLLAVATIAMPALAAEVDRGPPPSVGQSGAIGVTTEERLDEVMAGARRTPPMILTNHPPVEFAVGERVPVVVVLLPPWTAAGADGRVAHFRLSGGNLAFEPDTFDVVVTTRLVARGNISSEVLNPIVVNATIAPHRSEQLRMGEAVVEAEFDDVVVAGRVFTRVDGYMPWAGAAAAASLSALAAPFFVRRVWSVRARAAPRE